MKPSIAAARSLSWKAEISLRGGKLWGQKDWDVPPIYDMFIWKMMIKVSGADRSDRLKGAVFVVFFFVGFGTSSHHGFAPCWSIVDPFCTIYHRIYMSNRLPPRARYAGKRGTGRRWMVSRSPKNHHRNAENCQERSRILRDHQVIYWFMGFLLDFQLKYCLMILIPGGIPSSRTRVIRLQVNNRTQ